MFMMNAGISSEKVRVTQHQNTTKTCCFHRSWLPAYPIIMATTLMVLVNSMVTGELPGTVRN
jgi:hypothetical protein